MCCAFLLQAGIVVVVAAAVAVLVSLVVVVVVAPLPALSCAQQLERRVSTCCERMRSGLTEPAKIACKSRYNKADLNCVTLDLSLCFPLWSAPGRG